MLLVSTYVVCERLSVMHEPAVVVEILVQILQNTLYSEKQFQNTPPPPKVKILRDSKSESFRIPPPPENWNLARSWHFKTFSFRIPTTPPPPQKIEI